MKYKVTFIEDPVLRERALVSLWARNDLHKGRDPRGKFQWFYRDAPGGTAKAFFLVDGDTPESEPLGCCGLGSRTVWVDGQPVAAGLFADFAVDEAHRTLMPALTLQRALCGDARQRFPLTYGFPNPAAVGIFQRIGFPSLGTIPRFVAVLRYGPYVERVVKSRLLAKAAGAAIGAAVRGGEMVQRLLRTRRGRIAWGTAGDPRLDALFDQARRRYRFIGDRSSAFHTWRFARRPGLTTEHALLVDRAGRLLAYAVVTEKEKGVALLADFLGVDDAALDDLLAQLLPQLRSRGFTSATTFFLGSPAIARILQSRGFKVRESSKYVVTGAGTGLAVSPESLAVKEDWYLTEADRDN